MKPGGIQMSMNKNASRWTGFIDTLVNPKMATGFTERKAIWKKNKATLWYYPSEEKKYRIPIYLVYSLVNQPSILDLAPGISFIETLGKNGFEVYLMDFGIPGYADKDRTLEDYVGYIKGGAQQALRHSKAKELSIMGFCVGGSLMAMYAAITKEPIKNCIFSVAPFEFNTYPYYDKWIKAVEEEKVDFVPLIDAIGLIPPTLMEAGLRLVTAPVYYSPYLSLLNRAYDEKYRYKWSMMNSWTRGHIPFSGGIIKQFIQDIIKGNKLLAGQLTVAGEKVDLKNIKANLLVVATDADHLVPKELITPLLNLVPAENTQFILDKGGHANLSKNGDLPDFIKDWLPQRSEPI